MTGCQTFIDWSLWLEPYSLGPIFWPWLSHVQKGRWVNNYHYITHTDTHYLHPVVLCVCYCGNAYQHRVSPVNCLKLMVHLETMWRSLLDKSTGKALSYQKQLSDWLPDWLHVCMSLPNPHQSKGWNRSSSRTGLLKVFLPHKVFRVGVTWKIKYYRVLQRNTIWKIILCLNYCKRCFVN